MNCILICNENHETERNISTRLFTKQKKYVKIFSGFISKHNRYLVFKIIAILIEAPKVGIIDTKAVFISLLRMYKFKK
jgi:hypothetical protein